jgi:hypothetical protein
LRVVLRGYKQNRKRENFDKILSLCGLSQSK